MTTRFESKVVVVTGGSTGIGKATAERIAAEGGAVGVAATIPAGRISQPEEVAAFVAFLLSDESAFVTGAALAIDGGFTAQ